MSRIHEARLDIAVTIASSLIGLGEEGADNAGPFVEEMFRGHRKSGAWCAAFVATCLERSAAVSPVLEDKERRGAKALAKALVRRGGTELDEPVRGAVIVWHRFGPLDWRGHAELVENYDPETEHLGTIAGNVGKYPSKVRRRWYTRGSWRRGLYRIVLPG